MHLADADFVFDQNDSMGASSTNCALDLGIDVQTIALHEFGHWGRLEHSSDSGAAMYASYNDCQRTPASRPSPLGGATACAVLIAALIPWPSATAHDHRPPRTRLLGPRHSILQHGLLAANCWITKRNGRYVETCADAVWRFPDPTTVAPGVVQLRFLLMKHQRPHDVSVLVWRAVDSNERPIGEPEEIQVAIRKTRAPDGSRAYVLRGRALVTTDLYVWTFARWDDEEGSGLHQDAAWTFHVRAY